MVIALDVWTRPRNLVVTAVKTRRRSMIATRHTMAAARPKSEVPCLAVAWQRLPGLNGNPELFRTRNITKRLGVWEADGERRR